MSRLSRVLPLVTLLNFGWASRALADEPADLVLLGGKIVTLDRQESVFSSLAVRGGRIIAAGTDAEIKPLIVQGKTEVIMLAGRMVLPGFIESHCHAVGVAKGTLEQTYVEIGSIPQLQEWIREQARTLQGEKSAAGKWIEVPRNEITRFKERRFPTPAELDAACTTHPVLYNSVSDKWVLNTRGFEELGLLDPNSKIEGGEVLRDEAGRPLLIRGGTAAVRKKMPPRVEPTRDATLAALTKLLKVYNEVGITSIYERATDPASLGLYRELREQGKLTTRVTGTFRFSARTVADVEKYVAGLGLKPGEGDEWIKPGPLKITVDGGIHWGTTRLSEPYGVKRIAFYRLTDPEYRGEQFYSMDQMENLFETAHKLGWQMSCHVTGDEGTLRVLEALGKVAAKHPDIRKRRFTLIHAYFPSPEIIRQCRDLGVCVDTQGYLYYKDADTLAEIYGPAWAERFIGLGDWVRGGVPVAVNADHMIGTDPNHAMNSFNPFLMMSIGVTRKTQSGSIHGKQQALSRLDALRTVTTWPAYLAFDESKLGTLEVGKLADLVILGGDYLKCPDAEIAGLTVERTIVGGLTVFQKEPRR
jgi:predicted amidohydrolase YtcJ